MIEGATESVSEAEQGAALLQAGCMLHDVGDLAAAVPLLASAAAAALALGDAQMRALARNRAGAALLRLRRPQQAVEAWTDELEALEGAAVAEAKAPGAPAPGEAAPGGLGKAAAPASTAEAGAAAAAAAAGAAAAAAAVEALAVSGHSGGGGSGEANTGSGAEAAAGAAKKKQAVSTPLGDTRGRRSRAHGNCFMALLLTGAREEAVGRCRFTLSNRR